MMNAQAVEELQKRWATCMLELSQMCQKIQKNTPEREALENDFKHLSKQYIFKDLYSQECDVLFKPTLAAPPNNFRNTNEGMMDYFAGENQEGFLWQPWKDIRFTYTKNSYFPHHAISMGSYDFIKQDSSITTAEFTFVYYKKHLTDEAKIIAHHSSLPYTKPTTTP